MVTGKTISHIRIVSYFLILFFTVAFLYFFLFGRHVLFFQKEHFLFLFSYDYLKDFLTKPGGLLEYAGKFITQFYSIPAIGSIILAGILTYAGFIMSKILKILNPVSPFSLPLLLVPPAFMILMQMHYYYMMEYNLGFICIIAYFLLSMKLKGSFLPAILFPLLYYLAGAFSFIFLFMLTVYSIVHYRGPKRFYFPLISIIIAVATFFVFSKILFLVPDSHLLSFPLPIINDRFNKIIFPVFTIFLIFLPVLSLLRLPRRVKNPDPGLPGIVIGALFICFTGSFMVKMHNPQVSRVLNIEKAAYQGNWSEVIRIHEKYPSENLIGQYFYNVALSQGDLLCDKLFSGRQDFGTKSLILPWGDEHLEWGSYFFYTTGLINEAHRWAYEEMVVYGMRPHNIKMLIETNLLNGNFRMAKKYGDILKKTIFYRDLAMEYEKLADNTKGIFTHPELGRIATLMPKKDFFIFTESPESNLPQLLEANPQNRRAFEYMMSWLLLTKNVESVVNNIINMSSMGYTRLPRHLEEAVMIFYNNRKVYPELGGLSISALTRERFNKYYSAYVEARNDPATMKEKMRERFGDTFWYYFHFHQD